MTAEARKTSVRRSVTAALTVFFLGNVILAVLALATAFGGRQPVALLPEDTGAAVKVGIVLVGAALAWVLGRWLYLQMLNGDFRADESATGATALMIYLIFLFAGAVFVGPALWEWLVFLLLVLILIAVFGLRAVVGTTVAAIVIVACLAAGAILYFYLLE